MDVEEWEGRCKRERFVRVSFFLAFFFSVPPVRVRDAQHVVHEYFSSVTCSFVFRITWK